MKYIATVNGKTYTIEINREDRILCEGVERAVDFRLIDQQHVYSLLLDNASYEALIQEREGEYWVFLRGYLFTVQVEDERERRLREASGGRPGPAGEVTVKAPMPGLIVAVPVQEGQPVRKGEKLVLLESMKMQNEIRAPRDGVVKAVRVRPGQSVEQNQILVVLG
ncbi:MAG: biotin/lipoyl-containing protein [Thermoflexus sp.]|jgi:biotin carboxyl carrier protein|uniref:Acetyl/propionyl-CoA carboxylase, alpha subunit n=1 Tax=Thermoflexus hugenholtzii JAD2 TaxID=877466 RepID=A0A212QMY1_9CHLR|nr:MULTISPECIES: acetyl-CoA carboxylase biotin carboxyl carrier protein subunit [Thermoflexus]MDT7884517.1 biotin/lipoyl-containing protein [Thermoflexus sp.]MDT7948323.1 biotin/lipoyl-containing protein [Thermoflexus sp.]QWK10204.1 MAG: biotin/lipoyl-binding protein [Thermoflexus hugenholtzii]SNB60705.1 Acetyl/propionyl-CoA carboxylase, alpha subunit [Thermoflexus hugenholtzii JAD2]